MTPLLARCLVGLAGLVVCFRGYSTLKFFVGLSGFIVGASAVASHPAFLPPNPAWLAPILVLGAGLAGLLLVLLAYKVGIFLLGAIGLVLLVDALPLPFPVTRVERLLLLAVVALVGGLLARFLERFVLSIVTAAYGAFLVTGALGAPIGRFGLPLTLDSRALGREPWLVAVWFVLTAVGIAIQSSAGGAEGRGSGKKSRAEG